MTNANCAYIRPLAPARKAAGTNTAISTSVMPTIGPNSSSIALTAAARRESPASMWREAPSTITIASSTTMPIASTTANRLARLIVKPNAAIAAKAPISVTGHGRGGHQDCAPVLYEQDDDEQHQNGRFDQRFVDLVDRSTDRFGRIERDRVVQPGREGTRQLGDFRLDPIPGGERVRLGRLEDFYARGRLAVEAEGHAVALSAELDAGDVLEPGDA